MAQFLMIKGNYYSNENDMYAIAGVQFSDTKGLCLIMHGWCSQKL